MNIKKGLVMAFEGVDGVGKSTVMRAVSAALTAKGIKHVLTKEPGGPQALKEEWACEWEDYPFGFPYAGFRPLCVDNPGISHDVKRALFKADSIYNWNMVGKPAMKENVIVLTDRSMLSDLAYGAALTSFSMDQLYQFNAALCLEQLEATRIILLEVHPDIREKRLEGNITNEMDKLGRDKRDEIAAKYEEAINTYLAPSRVARVNTAIPMAMIVDHILNFISGQCQ